MILPLLCAFGFLGAVLIASLTAFAFPSFFWFFPPFFFLLKKPALAVVFLAFLLGFLRVDFYEAQLPVGVPYGTQVNLEGSIVAEIDRRNEYQKITLETEYGRVLVKASPFLEFHFGEQVRAEGKIERPATDIEGFNYANYLARYKIWSVMDFANVQVLQEAPFSVRSILYSFKEVIQSRLNRLYFEPEASFASGLLLGVRKGMPKELAAAFQQVGLTHLVAVSGYNISLVIAMIFWMLSFLPLKTRIWVSTGAVFLFVILVGASAAAVRAGFMGSITLWGLYSGRRSQAFFALLWSAVLMVLLNPYILAFDVGFQLSVASTLGILVFVPLFERWTLAWKRANFLRESFLLTVAAQIATLPLMAFHFGQISLVAPLSNVLAAPFIPFAMLYSGLSLIFGKWMAAVAWFYLSMVEFFALLIAKIPWAYHELSLGAFEFASAYFLLLFLVMLSYKSTLARAFGLAAPEVFSKAPS